MFVIFLLAAAVLLNILDNFSKALSVAYPDSKYGVLGFGCSIKAVVKSFAACKSWGLCGLGTYGSNETMHSTFG